MHKLASLGEVIATLEFTLDEATIVTLAFGKPQLLPRDAGQKWDNWACPFQTTGIGDDRLRCAYGVDALQALLAATTMAGAIFYNCAEYKAGRLRWLNEAPKTNLGLPVAKIIHDILPPDASWY